MLPLKIIPAFTLALLGLNNASPMNMSEKSLALVRRYDTIINCDNDLPKKDPDSDLNTQADLLSRALANMATLANHGFNELFDKGAGSPAFQHYFRPPTSTW